MKHIKILQDANERACSRAARYQKAYDVIDPKIPLKLSFRQVVSRNPESFGKVWIPDRGRE